MIAVAYTRFSFIVVGKWLNFDSVFVREGVGVENMDMDARRKLAAIPCRRINVIIHSSYPHSIAIFHGAATVESVDCLFWDQTT
jgi:hypothetical protein